MPMILVKKNPRGKVIRELSSEEETAVKTVCGLKKPATMALHNLANDILREMREYDTWLQCDCIPGDSPAMNFAALKNNTGTLYRKRAARTVLTGMCYSVGSATRQGSSSPTRFIGQSAMTSRT